jgi:hypothetical protein
VSRGGGGDAKVWSLGQLVDEAEPFSGRDISWVNTCDVSLNPECLSLFLAEER